MATLKEMKDKGYTFNKEFCGHPEKRIVVRFYGDFISQHIQQDDAVESALKHDISRAPQKRAFSVLERIIQRYESN